jgi:hypothetical protein
VEVEVAAAVVVVQVQVQAAMMRLLLEAVHLLQVMLLPVDQLCLLQNKECM